MFSLNENNKFKVYSQAVDLRKGINPLSGLVRLQSMSPTDGCVYVFMNRQRSRLKLLHWERGGYVMFYKRMEQGCISRQVFEPEEAHFVDYRWDEMVLLVEGISKNAPRRKRFNIK